MRKMRVRVVSVLLLLSLLLTGCSGNVKNYVHTESSLKREAADALEEKYDEEFVIHDVWTMSQTMFYATCSPEDEQDIVFEAKVYKDGRGVYTDEYIQGAVSKQLKEKLQPKFEEVYGECFVKVTFTFVGKSSDYYKDVTIEEFYQTYEDAGYYLQVFINKENLKYNEDIVMKEYSGICGLYDETMENCGCNLYFVEKDMFNKCQEESKVRAKYDDTIDGSIEFGFGYDDGVINKTLEEYDEVRREINTNEQ